MIVNTQVWPRLDLELDATEIHKQMQHIETEQVP